MTTIRVPIDLSLDISTYAPEGSAYEKFAQMTLNRIATEYGVDPAVLRGDFARQDYDLDLTATEVHAAPPALPKPEDKP